MEETLAMGNKNLKKQQRPQFESVVVFGEKIVVGK